MKIFYVTYEDKDAYLIEAKNLVAAATIVDRLLEPGHYKIEEVIFDYTHIFPLN